jgi:hypothetical protein
MATRLTRKLPHRVILRIPCCLSWGQLYNSTFWALGDELAGQINELGILAKNMFRVLMNVALAVYSSNETLRRPLQARDLYLARSGQVTSTELRANIPGLALQTNIRQDDETRQLLYCTESTTWSIPTLVFSTDHECLVVAIQSGQSVILMPAMSQVDA